MRRNETLKDGLSNPRNITDRSKPLDAPQSTGRGRPGSAREAIADFLRASARAFSEPGDPKGCLIVLGALNVSETNAEVFRDLSERRMSSARDLASRLRHAVAEGELPETVDCDAISGFYLAVQQGMSVQARDGASREALLAVADGAMAAWGALTAGVGAAPEPDAA